MKKTFPAFPRACLLLILLVSACNGGPPNPPPATGEALTPVASQAVTPSQGAPARPTALSAPTATLRPSSTLPAASALRGVQVRFWHPWSGEAARTLAQLVDQFNQSNEWGVTVQATPLAGWDVLAAALESAWAEKNPPELVVGYPYQLQAWQANGALVDLAPYVNDPVWGLSVEAQAGFNPAFWEQDQGAGLRLGFPALRSAQVLYYNVSWARELGFSTPPNTPEEFERQACAAAKSQRQDADVQNDGTGGWLVTTDYPAILGWLYAYGAEITTPEGGYRFDTPPVREAFTFLRRLYDQGCAWQSESSSPSGEFAGRLALFSSGSVTALPEQAEALRRASSQDEWTVLPFPSPAGQPAIDVYGPDYALLSTRPEAELAGWLFIRWLAAPENSARWVAASGSLPLNAASLGLLQDYSRRYPQWLAAVTLLPGAHAEPGGASWGNVRWTVSDAATQLFRSYFKIEAVPSLTGLLDQTAAELSQTGILSDTVTTSTAPAPASAAGTPPP